MGVVNCTFSSMSDAEREKNQQTSPGAMRSNLLVVSARRARATQPPTKISGRVNWLVWDSKATNPAFEVLPSSKFRTFVIQNKHSSPNQVERVSNLLAFSLYCTTTTDKSTSSISTLTSGYMSVFASRLGGINGGPKVHAQRPISQLQRGFRTLDGLTTKLKSFKTLKPKNTVCDDAGNSVRIVQIRSPAVCVIAEGAHMQHH